MQEFWFCSQCKSMNRSNSKQCYSCRAPKEQATLATVAERHEGVILTPGLDDEHREVAWALMSRTTYISAWVLGYLASVLCFLRAVAWCAFSVMFLPRVIVQALGTTRTPSATEDMLLLGSWLAFLGLSVVAIPLQGAFFGLTATNSPALGSGSPRFGPLRSALWWPESALWALRGSLAFFVPTILLLVAVGLFGIVAIIAGVVWFVCAFWLLGDPVTCLSKPQRLLGDLWQRLGAPGSDDSRTVTWWSLSWGTARGMLSAVCAVTFLFFVCLLIFAFFLYRGTGQRITMAGESQFEMTLTVIIILVYAVVFAAEAISLFLIAQITYGLGHRQRVREAWVLGGLDSARARHQAAAQAAAANNQAGYGAQVAPHQPMAGMPPQPMQPPMPPRQPMSPQMWAPQQTPPQLSPLAPPKPMPPIQPPAAPAAPSFTLPDPPAPPPLEPASWAPIRPVQPAPPSVQSNSPVWPPAPRVWPPAPVAPPAPISGTGPASPPHGAVIRPSSAGLSGLGETPLSEPGQPPPDDGWGEGL